MRDDLELTLMPDGAGPVCAQVLATLPEWFGIPEATAEYVAMADRAETIVARREETDVGVLTLVRHSPHAAEVYVVGVVPEEHRHGVGRAMLSFAEARLLADGVELLQVKTLSAHHPDANYARTREFYLAMGFRVMEEFPELWGPENPALQLVKILA